AARARCFSAEAPSMTRSGVDSAIPSSNGARKLTATNNDIGQLAWLSAIFRLERHPQRQLDLAWVEDRARRAESRVGRALEEGTGGPRGNEIRRAVDGVEVAHVHVVQGVE